MRTVIDCVTGIALAFLAVVLGGACYGLGLLFGGQLWLLLH